MDGYTFTTSGSPGPNARSQNSLSPPYNRGSRSLKPCLVSQHPTRRVRQLARWPVSTYRQRPCGACRDVELLKIGSDRAAQIVNNPRRLWFHERIDLAFDTREVGDGLGAGGENVFAEFWLPLDHLQRLVRQRDCMRPSVFGPLSR